MNRISKWISVSKTAVTAIAVGLLLTASTKDDALERYAELLKTSLNLIEKKEAREKIEAQAPVVRKVAA